MIRSHRLWILALGTGLAVLLFSQPLLQFLRNDMEEDMRRNTARAREVEQALQGIRADANTAEQLGHEVKPGEIESWLMSANRLQVATHFEPLATACRLSHFTYTLSPEKPYQASPPSPDAEGLVESALSLEAEAPQDSDVYRFLDQLKTLLPGHIQITRLSLERLSEGKQTHLGTTNVRFTALVSWLSNGREATQ